MPCIRCGCPLYEIEKHGRLCMPCYNGWPRKAWLLVHTAVQTVAGVLAGKDDRGNNTQS
jgi:hypothetical protein